MNVSEAFIRRPVMTILVMAAFLFAGLFGYVSLPVNALPNVDFPTIVVTANLPGADPETMAATVATPLESQFSLLSSLDSMNSTSIQGTTRITLQFRLDRNIDAASQDVQAGLIAAARLLPPTMPAPPTLYKSNPADSSLVQLTVSSTTLPLSVVDEYAETTVARALATIDGVANIEFYGQAHPAVRIQVDPYALAVRGIGIDQVAAAVKRENVNLATGQFDGPSRAEVIRAQGQLTTAADYLPQIIAYHNGAPVRFADVSTIIDGVENPRLSGEYNGKQAVGVGVNRQPGSNAVAIVDAVRAKLPSIRQQLPPSVQLELMLDRSQSIRSAIHDVQLTLLVAALLVVGVIFLFLRTASATFIASIALPITIIGTFAGMAAFGFNLDNLSLMALTLCVGFVVDDAIVMLENIMRHVEAGEDPYSAALIGSREVAFTIVSMTASLAAVFIPVMFMGGIVGRLLHEFAITIVVAILISGIVSVTLTPMLCSLFLKPAQHGDPGIRGVFHKWSETGFKVMQAGYARSLRWGLAHRRSVLMLFAASLAATVFFFRIMPADFLPSDDIGLLTANTEGANGMSFEQMVRHQDEAARILWSDPGVNGALSSVGSGGARGGSNQGTFRIGLKPRSERLPIDELITELRAKFARVPGLNVYLQNRPIITLGGLVSKSQYQYTLQDLDVGDLYAAADRLQNALARTPGFLDVTSDLDLSTPTVQVKVNRDRAAALGVSMQEIETALGASFGGQQISTIETGSDQFKVMLELLPQYQRDAQSLERLYLTGANDSLVPLNAVATFTSAASPLAVNHFGQLPAVTISFDLPPGVALSDAVTRLKDVEAQIGMPASVQTGFQGTAKAFEDSMQGMGFLLLGAVLVVYIVLGILYESFIHPLTILSGLPSAAVGALATLWLFHMPLTLYAFVGMVMLVGIVKKNAIMMIDFALVRQREHGTSPEEAIAEAALIRFRPIMMTTMAALVGSLPIALGYGQGGTARQPLGLAVVGGLLLSQALTLYITPVIYGYLERLGAPIGRSLQRGPRAAE